MTFGPDRRTGSRPTRRGWYARLAPIDVHRTVFGVVILPHLLMLILAAIMTVAVVWAWRNDALRTTDQERVDMEFERIVRRFDSPAR